MRTATSAMALAALLVGVSSTPASAGPFNPYNVRNPQITVNPIAGQDNLQDILNTIFSATADGLPDAGTSQEAAAVWGTATSGFVVTPVLQFQQNCVDCTYGMWSGSDSSSLTLVSLFAGTDPHYSTGLLETPTANFASVFWSTANSGLILTPTGVSTFGGINRSSFGFYLQQGSNLFYTADDLNGGAARSLAYQDPNSTNWAIAFDVDGNNSFNDGVLSVESLRPVPEPGTLALLAGGIVVGVRKLRNRRS